jgi:hypothetical protein
MATKSSYTFDAGKEKNGRNKIDNLASGFATHTAPSTARIQPDFKGSKKVDKYISIKLTIHFIQSSESYIV